MLIGNQQHYVLKPQMYIQIHVKELIMVDVIKQDIIQMVVMEHQQ